MAKLTLPALFMCRPNQLVSMHLSIGIYWIKLWNSYSNKSFFHYTTNLYIHRKERSLPKVLFYKTRGQWATPVTREIVSSNTHVWAIYNYNSALENILKENNISILRKAWFLKKIECLYPRMLCFIGIGQVSFLSCQCIFSKPPYFPLTESLALYLKNLNYH